MVGTKTIKIHETTAIASRINTPGGIPVDTSINMVYFEINISGGILTNTPNIFSSISRFPIIWQKYCFMNFATFNNMPQYFN